MNKVGTTVVKVLFISILFAVLVHINQTYLNGSEIVGILWLPSGLAIAVGLIGGMRYLLGVFIGMFIAFFFDYPISTIFGLALSAVVEAICGTWLLNRVLPSKNVPSNLPELFKLFLIVGVVSSIIGALLGTTTLLHYGIISSNSYTLNLGRWWMGDSLGIIITTPFILCWQKLPENWHEPKRLAETLLLVGFSFLAGQVVFLGWLNDFLGPLPKGYLMFLLIIVVALRLGAHATVLVILMAAIQGLIGALNGIGYFASYEPGGISVNYWFYNVVISIVGLSLAIFITAEQRNKQALEEQERFFRLITDNIDDFIAVVDLDGKRLYNSPSYSRLFGETKNFLLSDSFADVHPEDHEKVKQAFKETVQTGVGQRIEYRFVLPDGSIRYMESRGGVIRNVDGSLRCIAVVSHDVTERKKSDEKIYSFAYYDSLTQLPNRLMLKDRFDLAIAGSKRSRRYGALMVIDLDNFKPINDNYGHDAGDLLLKEAANRILLTIRKVDTVARFGGDEFVVILNSLEFDKEQSRESSAEIADKVRIKVADPYHIEIKTSDGSKKLINHKCTASIGVCVFLGDEVNQEDIFKCADMAMYIAKESGRDRVKIYDSP